MSLDARPARGAPTPEDGNLRHLLHGRKLHRYRIIYMIDDRNRVVTVLHIRHGARDAFMPDEPDNDTQATKLCAHADGDRVLENSAAILGSTAPAGALGRVLDRFPSQAPSFLALQWQNGVCKVYRVRN